MFEINLKKKKNNLKKWRIVSGFENILVAIKEMFSK